MSELQDIQLDLLEKFKSICKRWNLSYCASSGTLLGAARHKGFIPWDDDIDVFLPWEDYKTLMRVAPNVCKYPYCFQSIYTEPDAMPSACRLRRSDTTGYTKWEEMNAGPSYDRGIFIDIFPLFYVPDSQEARKLQKTLVIRYWECIHGRDALNRKRAGKSYTPEYEQCISTYLNYCANHSEEETTALALKEKYLEACAMVEGKTKEVGATSSKCHQPNLMWESSWFEEYIDLPFEGTTIRCPKEYEKVLEKQYGDWRKPVRDGARHEFAVLDVNTPWRDLVY